MERLIALLTSFVLAFVAGQALASTPAGGLIPTGIDNFKTEFLIQISPDQKKASQDLTVRGSVQYKVNGVVHYLDADASQYRLDSEVRDAATVASKVYLSGSPDKLYRVRVWGDFPNAALWHFQNSAFYRLNEEGEAAYEFMANVKTGEVYPVPADAPLWK